MRDRRRWMRLLRRLLESMRRRRAKRPVIDNSLTADDIRRAEELIEKYGPDFPRKKSDPS